MGLVVSMVVAAGFSFAAIATSPKLVGPGRAQRAQRAQQRVQALAAEMARAWHPVDRARVIERLRNASEPEELRGALALALRRPEGKTRKADLIECAGAMGAREVRNDIATVAASGVGPAQIAAASVAHKLHPYTEVEIDALLAQADPSSRLPLLGALARGGTLPDDLLVECLASEDASERDLAVRAFPARPGAKLLQDLERLIAHGTPLAAACALRALARCEDASAHEAVALACLQGRPSEVRRAALDLLLAAGAPVQRAEQIWHVVVDASADAKLRAYALHTLERLGGADVEALASQVLMMSPTERLFAARCLIRAGDARALDVLTNLVVREEDPDVVAASRRLLSWLTGARLGATPHEFQAAFERAGRHVRTRYLPAHGLSL
jgi:hypothetical protein